MGEYDERLARIEERVSALASDVREGLDMLHAKLDGGHDVPFERSVRGRLHRLENARVTAEAASVALREAQRERARAQVDRAKATSARRSNVWRWVGAIIAVAAILAPYIHGALPG